MRNKHANKVEAMHRKVVGENPIWASVSSRTALDSRFHKKIVKQTEAKFVNFAHRRQKAPKARIEVRIEVELPVGLKKSDKEELTNNTQQEDIDKGPAEQIVANMSELFRPLGLDFGVNRDSNRNWYILVWPTDEFMEHHWDKGWYTPFKPFDKSE